MANECSENVDQTVSTETDENTSNSGTSSSAIEEAPPDIIPSSSKTTSQTGVAAAAAAAQNDVLQKRRRSFRLSIATFGFLVVGLGIILYFAIFAKSDDSDSSSNSINEAKEDEKRSPDSPTAITTKQPSFRATNSPTRVPTLVTTFHPTQLPSAKPTLLSTSPSANPSLIPTATYSPSDYPSMAPSIYEPITTFYAIGDVPYDRRQEKELIEQMKAIPDDAEFVIHVGDIRAKSPTEDCPLEDYIAAAEILKLSPVPVFVTLGDNEWNDCPNHREAMKFWRQEFEGFDSKYWNHTFDLQHQEEYPENFAFVHKETLFIGLNLVGGNVHNSNEWATRLTAEYEWTRELILQYKATRSDVGRVVLFGHANPKVRHNKFFVPLQQFVQTELNNSIPMLYLNGDKHEWLHEDSFLEQDSFLRIMLTGGSSEPPLKVMVHANGEAMLPNQTFLYDRQLMT